VAPNEWLKTSFLEQLVGAGAKVTIRDGEKTVQNLQIK
jgi:hypothetical protein